MAAILVVDDDLHFQRMLSDICHTMDLEVRQAMDGAAALEMIYAGGIDVVLLDVNMPGLDGFGVLAKLKENPLPRRPAIIMVTGTSEVAGRMRGIELGATDFVTKPFRTSDLKRRIVRALNLLELERLIIEEQSMLAGLLGTDPVTGAGTFGQLHQVLEAEFKCAVIGRRPLTCIVVSDEQYISEMEQHGKEAATERLQSLSNLIGQRLRATDYVFRVDAAEFVILLPATSSAGAVAVVDKIFETVKTLENFSKDDVAIAVASYPHDDIQQSSELFRAVNLALVEARTISTSRVAYFSGFSRQ